MTLGIHGTGKYHCVSLDYIHGSKRAKNVSRNMWMLPNPGYKESWLILLSSKEFLWVLESDFQSSRKANPQLTNRDQLLT